MKRGKSGTAWSSGLLPLSWIYGGIVRRRNRCYDSAAADVRRAVVPVVSVGNLTVGGTGKTPLVIEIAQRLRRLGHRPAILTRGYGARAGETADEVQEFSLALPEVPVVVNPDRAAGAEAAVREHGVDCLVLDDGFQHRRLARDLDLVLIDALDPWGGGRLLPAGRLREPLESLKRADGFIVTRSNLAEPAEVLDIIQTLHHYAPGVPVTKAALAPDGLFGMSGEPLDLALLRGRSVLAVCGIGNPRSFGRLLERLTGRACTLRVYRDHHRYRRRDVQRLVTRARRDGHDVVVTTRKDWVKLRALWPGTGGVELWRLDARLVLADPRGLFDRRLAALFPSRTQAGPRGTA